MSKTFRPWDIEQRWLLPPSVHELVAPDHLAHFVRDTVREQLDLGAIFSVYQEERGSPPYHPAMMVALLLYAYSRGVYSSRKIAQACEERVDFMAVTALNRPDFRTIATTLEGSGRAVRAGAQAVSGGGAGQARPCGARRYQSSSQCQRAQGDVVWTYARGREEACRRGGRLVHACPGQGCRGGRHSWPGPAW